MPDSAAHRQRANENYQITTHRLAINDTDVDRAWIVTAYFYAALHWVEAYLATQAPPLHPRNHTQRKQLIAADPALSQIHPLYRELEDRSRDARYELRAFMVFEVETLRDRCLAPLRQYVAALLP